MEERAKILKMVADGKITAQEAEKLMDSMDKKMQAPAKASVSSTDKKKKLRIRVESIEEDKNVNISVPLSLAKFIIGFIPKNKVREMEESGVNLETILEHIEEIEMPGEDIVNIDSENEKVRIYIE